MAQIASLRQELTEAAAVARKLLVAHTKMSKEVEILRREIGRTRKPIEEEATPKTADTASLDDGVEINSPHTGW